MTLYVLTHWFIGKLLSQGSHVNDLLIGEFAMSFTCGGIEMGETLLNVWKFTVSPSSVTNGQNPWCVHKVCT